MIINEGDEVTGEDGLYVLWEGGATALKGGVAVRKYGPKEHFGELALLAAHRDSRRAATVVAAGGHSKKSGVSHLLRLPAKRFAALSRWFNL